MHVLLLRGSNERSYIRALSMISVNDRDTRGVDIGVENEHEITASRTVPRFANECH